MTKKAIKFVVLLVSISKVIYLHKVVTIYNQVNLLQAIERCKHIHCKYHLVKQFEGHFTIFMHIYG